MYVSSPASLFSPEAAHNPEYEEGCRNEQRKTTSLVIRWKIYDDDDKITNACLTRIRNAMQCNKNVHFSSSNSILQVLLICNFNLDE